jgi:hypothetical protein
LLPDLFARFGFVPEFLRNGEFKPRLARLDRFQQRANLIVREHHRHPAPLVSAAAVRFGAQFDDRHLRGMPGVSGVIVGCDNLNEIVFGGVMSGCHGFVLLYWVIARFERMVFVSLLGL